IPGLTRTARTGKPPPQRGSQRHDGNRGSGREPNYGSPRSDYLQSCQTRQCLNQHSRFWIGIARLALPSVTPMKRMRFVSLLAGILIAGMGILCRQQGAIAEVRSLMLERADRPSGPHEAVMDSSANPRSIPPPSPELIRLRGEVTFLRGELASLAFGQIS